MKTPLPRSSKTEPQAVDVYFSADVETDGPIPGPFSMLSFGLVFAGTFDGDTFSRPAQYTQSFYRELRPISDEFQIDALRVNGLDREQLLREGAVPVAAMTEAAEWVKQVAGVARPILVAYPLSFDWSFLYWYFTSVVSQADHLLLSAVRARVTFSRMSLALAVQMKGLGF
jgi:hypothetical protein